jgi:hypothetical protein
MQGFVSKNDRIEKAVPAGMATGNGIMVSNVNLGKIIQFLI